tara:strand:- start:214 stop:765 length:552 start_codon:yes stop_codon:yes gene_type:complete
MNEKYIGNLENNIRTGYGKLYNNDILVYEGEWINNKYDGKGRLYFKNGNVKYDGNWCNGEKVSGINYFENGSLLFKSAFDISESIIFDQEGDIDLLNEDINVMFEEISNNVNLDNDDLNLHEPVLNNVTLERVIDDLNLQEPLLNNNLNQDSNKTNNIILKLCKYVSDKIISVYNYMFKNICR